MQSAATAIQKGSCAVGRFLIAPRVLKAALIALAISALIFALFVFQAPAASLAARDIVFFAGFSLSLGAVSSFMIDYLRNMTWEKIDARVAAMGRRYSWQAEHPSWKKTR